VLETHTAIGSGRNGNKSVVGATSEAFASWLHRGHEFVDTALVELASWRGACRFAARYLVAAGVLSVSGGGHRSTVIGLTRKIAAAAAGDPPCPLATAIQPTSPPLARRRHRRPTSGRADISLSGG